MLKLYNTLSRKPEEFVPLEKGKVRFYHCGPTVYWTQHIGNLRGMTMGDLLVRTLRYFGYSVTHVRNYTDVGHLTSDEDTGIDKMEKGAKREGLTPSQIADKYIRIFEADTQAINLLEPTFKPRATEYVGEMIKLVSELLAKGFAYVTDLAVYFEVSKFPKYTELSKQKLSELQKGAGKADVSDPAKKSPLDFALWFFRVGSHAKALQFWPSPFGEGFPGWHIECSAMSRKLLGTTIDIHMGGLEHIPVHHTNEIAQSEAANGVKFVNYWLHNEWLVVEEKKMAKSAGTGLSVQEVIDQGFDPLALRYFYLTAHYRSRQNFTWEALKNAQQSLNQLRSQVLKLRSNEVTKLRSNFDQALANDLNLPQALAVTWEALKSELPPQDKYALVSDLDQVLGLNLADVAEHAKVEIPAGVQLLVEQREQAREAKDFQKADEYRKQIETQGFLIEDTSSGSKLKLISSRSNEVTRVAN